MKSPHRRSDAQDDLEGVLRKNSESFAGHPRTETQDDVGNAGFQEEGRSSP